MLILLALAAEISASPSGYDPLSPPLIRVATSFRCGSTARSIGIDRTATGDTVESLSVNARPIASAGLASVKRALAPIDRIDEVRPLCAQGPERILIKGRSGGKKRSMMVFFGPNNQVAVREVG